MGYELSGSNYSETDASNSNASPAGMPENMAPSGVNDSWRAGMGSVKRSYDRDHAGTWCTVGGTANAITLTYSVGPTAYVQGERFAFKATAANTGATTVEINGVTPAQNIYKHTASGPAALAGGEIQIGDIVILDYDGTQFQLVSPSALRASAAVSLAGTDADLALTSAGFGGNKNLATPGHYSFPGKFEIIWGTVGVAGSGSSAVTFDNGGFATACVGVFLTPSSAPASGQAQAGVTSVTKTGFTADNGYSGSLTFFYMAIGY